MLHSSKTYSSAPWLTESDDDMLVFLCSCLPLKTIDAAIHEWAESPEGSDFYQQTMLGFLRYELKERACLRVLALLSFERLLPPCPDGTLGPIFGCYLEDFDRHLDGEFLDNREAILERMAHSLRRVVGEECCPRIRQIFDMVGTEGPLHSLDGVSDVYWVYKVNWGLSHIAAWNMTWMSLENSITRGGADLTIQ